MFLPEPENNYDTNAVAIKRMLDGAHLGYLPRTDQHIYTKGQIQFGRISDCGGFTPRRSYSDYDEYSSQEEFLFFARVSPISLFPLFSGGTQICCKYGSQGTCLPVCTPSCSLRSYTGEV